MSFRRIPFQFSSTDPVQRQIELEKRFGLPGSGMYVDVANPLSMGSGNKEPNLTASSPRLQHRVPIFVEGRDQPIKSSVDSVISNSDCKKKSNVRVIPIEIEGAESRPATRHRTFSGPAGWAKASDDESVPEREEGSPLKRSMQDLTEPSKMRATEGPVVHNIPIKIEGRSEPIKNFKSDKLNLLREEHSKLNGCAVSKQPTKIKSPEKEHTAESHFEISVKKIQNVLEELKLYDSDVQKFAGTMKDKQYRYLDEMLTRCMLRLDDIDTMGNEEVRSMRKNAIKKVQASIDLLETKVNPDNRAVAVGLGNIAEMHTDGEEVISTDVKEMNSENVEERNSRDQASEFEMTEGKEAESELQSRNSDVVSHVPSNNLTTITRTEELPKEADLNEIEMVPDECKANTVSTSEMTEVKIDQRMPDASEVPEVEMTEADNLFSSRNVDPEKINEVCAVEMIENKLDESESQTSNVNTTLKEIAANESAETIENPKIQLN